MGDSRHGELLSDFGNRRFEPRLAASQRLYLKAALSGTMVINAWPLTYALALRLATDAAMRQSFRRKLADNQASSALFDTDRLRRHIEAAYAIMWERCRRGERPQSFRVEPLDAASAAMPRI